LIHQTTQKGKPFGVATKQLDYDRWVAGGLDSLYAYAKVKPPEAALTLEERVAKLEKDVADLKNRM